MATDWSAFGGSGNDTPSNSGGGSQRTDWSKFGGTGVSAPWEQRGVGWLAGGQQGNTENAFDNDFYDTWNKQVEKAASENRLLDLYGQDDFTGIVTRDDAKYGVRFGDVFRNGQKQFNVLQNKDIPEDVAYQMLGRVTLSDDELAHATNANSLKEAVENKRRVNEDSARKGRSAQVFQDKVDKRQDEFNKGFGDETMILATAAGGGAAALGAGAAIAAATGVGLPVAAILGLAAGGIALGTAGGLLNKDLLSENFARQQVLIEEANRRKEGAGVTQFLRSFGEAYGQTIQPTTNVVMGGYDLVAGGGKWNDEAEWYATDPETGESLRNGWWDVARFGAGAVDAFGSSAGAGRAAYVGSIGASLLGQGSQLAYQGEIFNDRSGEFQSIYTDEDGNLDLFRAGSAWAAFGIDAVQSLGVQGMLSASARRGQRVGGDVQERVSAGGLRFNLDAEGRAVGSVRPGLAFLAPSESFRGIAASSLLRIRNRGVAADADDLYRAIRALETKAGAGWGATLVTGLSEGYEEGVQAVLNQWATGSEFDLDEVVQSAQQGLAMGLGFGAGGAIMARGGDRALRAAADAARVMKARGSEALSAYTDEEWNALSDTQKRAAAQLSQVESAILKKALGNASINQARKILEADPAAQKRLEVARIALAEEAMKKAAPNTKSYMRITAFDDPSVPGDKFQASFVRVATMLEDHRTAIELMASGGSPDQTIDPDTQALAGSALAELDLLMPWLESQAVAYRNENLAGRRFITRQINAVLNFWGSRVPVDPALNVPTHLTAPANSDEQVLARAYAVSINLARDPIDQKISFQLLVPTISDVMTEMNANQTIQVSYSLLNAIGGDFDGDRIRSISRLVTTPDEFLRARSGERSVTAVRESAIETRKFELAWMDQYRQASGAAQFGRLVLDTRARIRDEIRTTVSPDPRIQQLLSQMFAEIRAGVADPSPISMFVTRVMQDPELATSLLADGRDKLYNVPERLNRIVSNGLAEFSERLSVVQAPADLQYNPKEPIPARQGGPKIAETSAVTRGRTAFLESPAVQIFRIFQQLRYSPLRSPVEARHLVDREEPLLADLQDLYLQLGQGEVESAVEAAYADAEVNARVIAWLEAMSAESANQGERIPVAVLSSMSVPHFNDKGEFDGMVTLAQSLLERSLAIDEAKYGPLIESDVNLKARFARIKELTKPPRSDSKEPIHKKRAGAAFVYIFGQMSVEQVVGQHDAMLNAQATIDTLYREYSDQDYHGRRSWMRSAKSTAMYPDRRHDSDLPYSEETAMSAGVTPYSIMIDAIEEAGNFNLAVNEFGDPTGIVARQSDDVSKEVNEIVSEIHEGIRQAALPEHRELTMENLQIFLQQNPRVSEALINLVAYDPKLAAVFADLTFEGDSVNQVRMAPWLYEALLLPPKQAELSILMNSALLSWRAKDIQTSAPSELDDDPTGDVRDYGKLDDRLHQLFFVLGKQDPSGMKIAGLLADVEKIMNSGGGVQEFIRLLNTKYRGNQAPFVAWNRDVGTFDSSAVLRFGASVAGTEQRKAISELHNAVKGLSVTIAKEQEAQRATSGLLAKARAERAAGTVTQNGPRMALREAIQFMREFEISIGPNEMVDSLTAALETFYAKAADKGVGPDEFAPVAAPEVLFHEFGINFTRVDTSSGTIDLDTVIANPQILLRGPITIVDREGNEFEWLPEDPSLTDEDAIEDRIIDQIEAFVLDNWEGATRSQNLPVQSQGVAQSLIRRLLEPSVWQLRADGRGFEQRSLVDDGLYGLLSRDAYSRLLGDANAPIEEHDQGSLVDLLTLINSSSNRYGQDVAVQRYLARYLAHAASSLERLSASDAQRFVQDTMHELGYVLGKVGDLVAEQVVDDDWTLPQDEFDRDGNPTDVLTNMRESAREQRLDSWLRQRFQTGLPRGNRQQIDQWLIAETNTLIMGNIPANLQERWERAVQSQDVDAMNQAWDEIHARVTDPALAGKLAEVRFVRDVFLSREPVRALIEMFGYPPAGDGDAASARRVMLSNYVKMHFTDLRNRNPWADGPIHRISNATGREIGSTTDPGTTAASESDWNEVSRAVIAMEITRLAGRQGAAEVSLPQFPKLVGPDVELTPELKDWDPSQQYIFDELLDIKSPLVRAAANISMLGRRENSVTPSEVAASLDRGLGKPERLHTWTLFIPGSAKEANDRFDSAAAEYLVAMGGQPQDFVSLAAATRSDFDPAKIQQVGGLDANLVSVTLAPKKGSTPPLTVGDLVYGNPLKLRLQTSKGSQPGKMMPLANLHGRFVKTFKVGGVDQPMEKFAVLDPASGYWVLDLDRARQFFGKTPRASLVEIELVTQDQKAVLTSTGDTTGLAHSQYFDGVIDPITDIDSPRSLIGAMLSAAGGFGRLEQQNALQANKKGVRALRRATLFSRRQRAVMETSWATDLSRVLHLKAMGIAQQGYNLAENDWRFYNAFYKLQETKHFVISAKGMWSAARVIQWQNQNPGVPITSDEALGPDARLYVPPMKKLRAMYGDYGPKALNLPNGEVWTGDPTDIPIFDGVSTERLAAEIPGAFARTKRSLMETELAARRPFQKYAGTRFLKSEKTMERAHRLVVRDTLAERIDSERFNYPQDWEKVSKAGIDVLKKTFRSMPNVDWRTLFGIPIDAKSDELTQHLAMTAVQDRITAANRNGREAVLLFRETDTARTPGDGVLTAATWGRASARGIEAGPRDILVVDVDSWTEEQFNRVGFERMRQFMETGAEIYLATENNTVRAGILARFLQQSGRYEPVPGSPYHYRERNYQQPRSRDTEALDSTLVSTQPISGENKAVVFKGFTLQIEENAAGVKNPEYFNQREVAVATNIVPTRVYPGFAVPKTDKTQRQVVNRVKELAANKPSWMSESMHRAIVVLDKKYDSMRSGGEFPLGQLREGDAIPLVKSKPNGEIQIYFARYKHNDANWRDVQQQFKDHEDIAYTDKEVNSNFTGFEGWVEEFTTHSRNGIRVRMRVPLEVLGDKKQVALGGLKYVISGLGLAQQRLPKTSLTRERDIDLVTDANSANSKNGWQGDVGNHRSAAVVFGWDIRDKVLQAFREATNDPNLSDVRMRELLREFAQSTRQYPAAYLREMMSDRAALARLALANGSPVDISQDSPLSGYLEAVIVYLMGAERERPSDNPVNHVLGPFSGLLQGPEMMGATAQELPRLFTEYFDSLGPNHPTVLDIRRTWQERLNRDQDGYYILNPDFTITAVTTDKRGRVIRSETGRLQIAEINSTGDNPAFDRFAERSDRATPEDWSPHTAALAMTALGTTIARSKDIEESARRAVSAEDVIEITLPDENGATILDAMVGVLREAQVTETGYRWQADTPAREWYRKVSRNLSHAYRVEVDYDKWVFPDDKPQEQENRVRTVEKLIDEIIAALHLDGRTQRHLVHYWVRQNIGQFADKDPESTAGDVTYDLMRQSLVDILANVEMNILPVVDADVPLIHRDDLAAIFEANRDHPHPWLLREGVDIGIPVHQSATVDPTNWSGWVHVALGTAETGQRSFDNVNLTAVDGMLQSYTISEDNLRGLPISRSDLRDAKLWDPKTSRMVISIDPRRNAFAGEPMILDPTKRALQDEFGVSLEGSRWQGARNLSPDKRRRDQYRKRYRAERGISTPIETGVRNFRKHGEQWVGEATTKNGLVLAVHDLRHFTTLFNPLLWLGAGVELAARNIQDDVIGLVTGTSTGGLSRLGAGLAAKVTRGTLGTEEISKRLQAFHNTQKALAENPNFAGMMYADMQFKEPHIRRNFVTKFTGWLGRSGDWMQDPTYGQPQHVMARRYLEAVMDYVNNTDVVISEGQLLFELEKDPQWVKKHLADAHRVATARVSNMRSLKMTSLGLLLRSIYQIPGSSQNGGVRMFSDLFLKTPLMYSGYLANVATNMLGLNTANNMLLMFLNGRKAGKFAQRALGDSYIKDGVVDLTPLIDTMDLTRSFVSDGLVMSSFFMAAAFAGATGLASGEDEEERRRRLAMLHQGGGIIYDPREIENDWRSHEALYLENIPVIGGILADITGTRGSGGVPHWIIRQFSSPVLGITRAVETGNMEHVKWGFQDVLGSLPLFNETMAIEAAQTFDMLTAQADEAQYLGTDTGAMKALGLLTKAVMSYESMVLESSFANFLYQQADKWDRDPFVIPDRLEDGTYVRDRMDVPRPTRALEDFYDPETGELLSAYRGRDWFESTAAGFSENRITFAFLMSLGTGLQSSQYWRNNMVAKTRTIEKEEMTEERAANLVMGLFDSTGFADDLTRMQNGEGIDQSWLLSSYREDGSEELTDLGAEAVIRGVWNGSVRLGDKALEGLYIPYEMRERLQDMFLEQFTQEGVDLGLSQQDAVKRAKLIGYGPFEDSSVPGLFDLIWSDQIPYTKNNRYYQLNTTYVTGPDGKPWATAVERNTLLRAFGFPIAPFYNEDTGRGLPTDAVLNAVDYGANLNTGLRALEKTDESWIIPTPEDIGESIEKAIEKLENKTFTPSPTYDQYTGYGRRGYGGGGGGGRSYANNSLMPFLNGMRAPYADSVPQIYIQNINQRREDIRRERFSSERGRLNQQQ